MEREEVGFIVGRDEVRRLAFSTVWHDARRRAS